MTPSLLEHINSGKTVEIDDLRFFYLDEGKGEETILLLPGFLTTSYNYRKLVNLLSAHYRVIALDFLGTGFSTRPDGPLSHRLQAHYLAPFLEKVVGDKKVHVVAFDYSLPILCFTFKEHANQYKSLSILGGFMNLPKFRFYFPLHFLRLPLLGEVFSFLFRPPLLRLIYKLFLVNKTHQLSYEWEKTMYHLLFEGKARKNTLEFVRNVDRSTHALREIEEGAKNFVGLRQIYIGEEDFRISPNQTEYMKETLRTSSLVFLPAKHLPMEECPEVIFEKLHYFVDSFSHKKTKTFHFNKQNKD
ncbi:alpha/beta fold hydrolase [Leptospira bandrabouensis]|uniref:Alpha/beta hydrolase n=1 Tax=Leptospira bandrabouensis TaxID=2484903 RepID=A0A6H3NU18_9LEPT|nr:alpha/beta hydrolase [Leptospira bandrabouensis]MCG6143495.1 alpha/beta hydrolase [Leptospira bandrabouensis]MCG6151463.1 alpha/beta hydrolase [Leptospira bandrabouensis]MCG6159155.1 alpha/beta hydrolase [Leptospira bandrabouensis]MCG6163089.1 alpha/beta hydrolase [Leptospira bandrabouensis]TGN04768.1 alpha/beta hydrolase [Leptospira bandrabouensis]